MYQQMIQGNYTVSTMGLTPTARNILKDLYDTRARFGFVLPNDYYDQPYLYFNTEFYEKELLDHGVGHVALTINDVWDITDGKPIARQLLKSMLKYHIQGELLDIQIRAKFPLYEVSDLYKYVNQNEMEDIWAERKRT